MLSLILPYFQRQEAADTALALIERHYQDMQLEVVVVDDGSEPPFRHTGFNPDCQPVLRVVRLPAKRDCKATCVPFNRGVSAASHDILALSSVEILHKKPVLQAMLQELLQKDKRTYVSAAVWCAEQNRWHSHSSLGEPLNFMTMLHRDLWEKAGGMDEDYREGVAFDDNDFLNRLKRAGAKFVQRDDLVVEHPRKGAKAKYLAEQHERNRKLYAAKWA